MVAQLPTEVRIAEPERVRPPRWHPLARLVFRFAFVYVGVGMAGMWLVHALIRTLWVPVQTVTEVARWLALFPLTDWLGAHVFDVPTDYRVTGSGDTAAQWVSMVSWLLVAVIATAVWSLLDRRRADYRRLYEWFRLLLRVSLISALLLYGMVKVLPTQMSFNLGRLVEPFGELSPMGVLWAQTSVSEPYEIALGAAEVTAALLLVLPRTAGLGAILAFIVTLQVALMNLTFDVPVKLFSLQLLAFSAVLAAPDIRRIVAALLGLAVPVRTTVPLLGSARGNRLLLAAQAIFGVWLLFAAISEAHDGWHLYGSARPHSPLYGIWNITEFTSAGKELPAVVDFGDSEPNPATIGSERFQRIIFDVPEAVTIQRMNDSQISFYARIDTDHHTISLSADPAVRTTIAIFGYQQPQPDRLTLDGSLGGRSVHMVLEAVDLNRYPVVARGFHWVQPAPYLR